MSIKRKQKDKSTVMYILFGAFVLVIILMATIKGLSTHHRAQDSALKRRAIFNAQQQLTFKRLKEVLPEYFILAQVSYDTLLTTKFLHTRYKYRNMIADFVVLNTQCQVVSVIILGEVGGRRSKEDDYEEELLRVAGYKVIRYSHVPTYKDLLRYFTGKIERMQKLNQVKKVENDLKRFDFISVPTQKKIIL